MEARERIVHILGTVYTIREQSERDNKLLEGCDGYCDWTTKEIVVEREIQGTLKDMEMYIRKVLRHEIVHAFLHESGLDAGSDWAINEEIVDWIALQFEKMQRAMQEVGALSCGGT